MKKENEIWKVIPNYENYEASNFGRIRSIDRVVKRDRYTTRKIKGKILQQFAKNSGYLQVNLSKNSKIETKTVHRLVAITFLENTNNYTDVNHKDENKHNNNINNLEWCTRKYNMNYNKLPLKKYKKVLKFNKEGCLLCIYTSLKEAAELTYIKILTDIFGNMKPKNKKKQTKGRVKNATPNVYNGIKFRSKLETYTYKKLKEAKIPAEYESTHFELIPKFEYNGEKVRAMTYLPDFIGKDFIIECKGLIGDSFPLRWKIFKYTLMKSNSNYKLYLVRNQKQVDAMIDELKTKN